MPELTASPHTAPGRRGRIATAEDTTAADSLRSPGPQSRPAVVGTDSGGTTVIRWTRYRRDTITALAMRLDGHGAEDARAA